MPVTTIPTSAGLSTATPCGLALGQVQADTIIPDPGSAQAYNRYSYVNNNPLRYNDPTGHDPVLAAIFGIISLAYTGTHTKDLANWALVVTSPAVTEYPDGSRTQPPASSEETTVWLIDQMKTNSQSDVVHLIRKNWREGPGPQNVAGALAAWNALVRTGAIWDFKGDLLEAGLETVELGGEDFSYQAVANIHYGFVGRAAGIGGTILQIGGGAAQLKWLFDDPENVGSFAYENSLGNSMTSYFDQPFDSWCVIFGMYLHHLYGENLDGLTEDTFTQALEQFSQKYGTPPPLD